MFSLLENGIPLLRWSCDVVFDGFCSFTATSHLTTTASEMLCTKAFQETCGSVAAKRQKIKTVKTLTSVCVGLSVLTRFKVDIFPREQAPGQKIHLASWSLAEPSHTS